MSIFEAVGIAWIIFTSVLATLGIVYLSFIGLRVVINRCQDGGKDGVPVEVKEMFKIAR